MYSGRLIPALAVALAALLGPAAVRSEASELQKKLATFARNIASLLKEESQTEIALGEWTGPPEPASSSGPGIQNILVAELGKHEVKINQKASLTVKGDWTFGRDVALATGNAGDVILCHPFLVHATSWPNRGPRPRLLIQPAIELREPLRLDPRGRVRPVERAILRGLGREPSG